MSKQGQSAFKILERPFDLYLVNCKIYSHGIHWKLHLTSWRLKAFVFCINLKLWKWREIYFALGHRNWKSPVFLMLYLRGILQGQLKVTRAREGFDRFAWIIRQQWTELDDFGFSINITRIKRHYANEWGHNNYTSTRARVCGNAVSPFCTSVCSSHFWWMQVLQF